jgi:plasmid maintenance system antidote protein VapI
MMHSHGWSQAQVARVLECGELHVFKYLTGLRGVSPKQANQLRREFGPDADAFVDACNAAKVRVREPRKVRREASKPRVWRAMPNPPEADWDGETYTIAEWRRRFGAPGSSQGQHGRVEGYYPSEPCFIGE